jgi:Malectin domain
MKIKVYFRLITSAILFCVHVHTDKVIFAVNLGGVTHKGSDGVTYQSDSKKLATWFTYKRIAGVTDQDQPIYNTQFSSQIHQLELMLPVASHDGDYTLILKYTPSTYDNLQNVTLNEQHLVVKNLSVSEEAGSLYTAYDLGVDFRISAGVLEWGTEQSRVVNHQLRLQAFGLPETQLAAIVLRFQDDNAYRRSVKGSSDDEL